MISARPGMLLGLGAVLAVVAFQLWITPTNPPGSKPVATAYFDS